jgi:hypothetical protein
MMNTLSISHLLIAQGVGGAPYGHQIDVLEWRHARGGLHRAVDGLHHCRQGAQGAQAAEGDVWATSSVTCLERKAG